MRAASARLARIACQLPGLTQLHARPADRGPSPGGRPTPLTAGRFAGQRADSADRGAIFAGQPGRPPIRARRSAGEEGETAGTSPLHSRLTELFTEPTEGDAMGDDYVIESVARAVRSIRRSRGLSLDQLASRAGVSKGALVSLESAMANPTLGTLVRLADALAVPVSALVERTREPALRVADAAATQPLWQGPQGGSARLLLTTATAAPVELWRWQLFAGETYESHPHPPGIAETVTVITGTAVIGLGATEQVLSAGMTAAFAADVPHFYRGQPPSGAEMLMTVHLPAHDASGEAGTLRGSVTVFAPVSES
jgi:transcriptional regulator with XRE-family HTH domain